MLHIALFALLQAPAQFQGLPADSTDYTCSGTVPCATWGMPPMPSAGGSYSDPVYGTTAYRLAVPANSKTGNVIPAYSRVQAFNSDGTRMMVADGTTTDLYDSTTTPPTPIGRIILAGETYPWIDSVDNDAYWSNTDPHRIYFTSYSSSHGLDLRYVDVSNCTTSSCTLTPQTVHTFSCLTDSTSPLGSGIAGNKIETGSGAQGGMHDATDRYFAFSCDFVNTSGRNEIDVIRYDRTTDTVTTQEKWYMLCPGQVPSGCKVITSVPKQADMFRMSEHPNGMISIIWQNTSTVCPAVDSKWVRTCGTEIFDSGYNYLGPANAYNGHQDMGFAANGDPVWVGGCNSGTAHDYRCLQITNLNALSQTAITGVHILLPCTYSYIGTPGTCESGTNITASKSWHISLTAWSGRPGWALLSTFMMAGPAQLQKPVLPAATTLGTAVTPGVDTVMPVSMATIGPGTLSVVDYGLSTAEMINWTSTTATTATATFAKAHAATATVQCVSCGNTGFGAEELLAIKIDDTAPDYSPAIFYRIGRSRTIRNGDYNCEAHGTVSRDFSSILWASSWDQDCSADSQVNAYWLSLKKTLNFNCPTVVTQGQPFTCTIQ